jgi:hypothetical protein
VAQRASQSGAAAAVNKLAARLAGSDRRAGFVRINEDQATEAEALDKAVLAPVTKEPAKRDTAAEPRIRDLAGRDRQAARRAESVFTTAFPDYVALLNPQPIAIKDIQALLSTARRCSCMQPATRQLRLRDDPPARHVEAD